MGIRKSKITPSINVDDMLKKVEISHETETEKLDVDKRLKEICEIKGKHSKKCTFYTLRFGCSFAAVNTIKPQLL